MNITVLEQDCEVCKEQKSTGIYDNFYCCGGCLGLLVAVNVRLIHLIRTGKFPEIADSKDVPAIERI